MASLTAEQRVLRSRIAAFATNARHDGREITAAARATYRASFEAGHGCAVCPRTDLPATLSPAERSRRGELLRRAHYARLALKSSVARSNRRTAPERDSGAVQEADRAAADRTPTAA